MNSNRFISPVNLQQLEAFFGPGRPIPNVNSREFEPWLEKLELSDPDGALRVRDCLEVAEVPEAVAMQQKKAAKENRSRARWTQLLYRVDETGKVVPDKAKMQIVGASALLMAALVFVGLVVVRPAQAIGVNTSLSDQLQPGATPAQNAAVLSKAERDAAAAAAAARGNGVEAIGPDGKPVLGPDGKPMIVPKPPSATPIGSSAKVATPAAVGSAPSTTMTNYDAAPASASSPSTAAGSDAYGSSGGSSGGRSGVSSAGGGSAGGAASMNGLPRAAPIALASPASGSGSAVASKAQLGGSERTRGLLAVGARLPSVGVSPSGGAVATAAAGSGSSSAGGNKPAIGTGVVSPASNPSITPGGMAVGAVASAPVREVPSAAMSSGTASGGAPAARPNGGNVSPMAVFAVAGGAPASGVARSDGGTGASALGSAARGSTPVGGLMIGGRVANAGNAESVGSSGGSSAGGFSAGGGAVNATPGIPGGGSGLPAGSGGVGGGGAVTSQSQSQSGASQSPPRSLSSLYPSLYIGARIKARVVLDIVAVEQGETPIVAETSDFPCGASDCPRITWIGVARLGPDRRIWAQFNQAVVGSETFAVIGQAYGATDLRLGLPASVQDEAPSLISDLVRGTIGGLSDFLKSSLGAQTTTIIPGGGAQQSSSVPGLESFFLGRVGDLFSIPSGSKALIRVARTPLNTEINILYGVAQNYAGSGTR